MPANEAGPLPRLLSQTGAFADTPNLRPVAGLIPYDIVFSFWSDGASKSRWILVPADASAPDTKIKFSATGEWAFPKGTVFVKHFELATDERHPEIKRRLETRLLVCDDAGGVYGATYKWRADNRDADLLGTNLLESIAIQTASGVRTQRWYYPSRQDCLVCHNRNAGMVLGVKTRQMNRDLVYPSGVTDNELRTWNHLGLFEPKLDEDGLANYPCLARPDDPARSVEDRARSYLDANCAQCHRPKGTVAYFDARYDTPLARQGLVGGPVLLDEGIDGARAIAPKDIWRSILYMRVNSADALKMPPLAHEMPDRQGTRLLREWIDSMSGPSVLPPPTISPAGGDYAKAVTVTLSEAVPGATIHYTLDGSKPTTSDPVYDKPLRLASPATLRAKAFESGYTKSITAQETYIVGD